MLRGRKCRSVKTSWEKNGCYFFSLSSICSTWPETNLKWIKCSLEHKSLAIAKKGLTWGQVKREEGRRRHLQKGSKRTRLVRLEGECKLREEVSLDENKVGSKTAWHVNTGSDRTSPLGRDEEYILVSSSRISGEIRNSFSVSPVALLMWKVSSIFWVSKNQIRAGDGLPESLCVYVYWFTRMQLRMRGEVDASLAGYCIWCPWRSIHRPI